MILSALAPLLLLPFVTADVHKLKLKKLPPGPRNNVLESAYLAEKYGGQTPIMGAGGVGRNVRVARPEDDLLWTQEELLANGGHGVPLSSR